MPVLVIDTNIVLDLWVFHDPTTQALHNALSTGQCRWLWTTAMLDELVRVLGYPKIVRRMAANGLLADELLARIASHASLVPCASAASVRCADPDDQKFIDLAIHLVAHLPAVDGADVLLLSKDHAVRCLAKPLRAQGVTVSAIFPPLSQLSIR